ncbi:hypothetical protein UFOVP1608_54 [uncultured Caudovirales phage]|uniref:Uncharacterized protein n=1 Tax=uncultured Caudovirales phage TaxID=2100421 RepID=A0A6J5SW21_9CAUD|nr:hypothetical protein UFOVP1608_54 [uncultured Caudovirales phage]
MNALIDWLAEPILTNPPKWFWIAMSLGVMYLLFHDIRQQERVFELEGNIARMKQVCDQRIAAVEAVQGAKPSGFITTRRVLSESQIAAFRAGAIDTELDEILDRGDSK